MHKLLRSVLIGLFALATTVVPALSHQQQQPQQQEQQQEQQSLERYVGTYAFEVQDYGVITVDIALTEKGELTIAAMGSAPQVLKHVEGKTYEVNTPDYGLVRVGFVEEEDGSISAVTLDSYEFSFLAVKQKQ